MFERQVPIPSAREIAEELPMTPALLAIKGKREKLAADILTGRSQKFLLIVGPCSAHGPAPVLEYVRRLGNLQKKVAEKLVLIPRIYTDKPRSKGVGYKGMFSQPDPEEGEDILRGIRASRSLHLDAMEESGLIAADEMLYPENISYLEDVLGYVAVGARSSENQLHRLVASGLEVPVGIKNPMSGSLDAMLNSVFAAQSAQTFLFGGWQVATEGNPLAHAVLRGRVDEEGNDIPNYGKETIEKVAEGYHRLGLKDPALIVDTNHSNSGKQFKKQIPIAEEVMRIRNASETCRQIVKGLMIESFLEEGRQDRDEVFGRSITDPCLGWVDTERLILEIAEKV